MKDNAQKSLLEWLAPEFAAKGLLLRDEPWVHACAYEAENMFAVRPLAIAAVTMVVVEPFAIDYLRQAPVLVVAASQGMECFRPSERDFIQQDWQAIIQDRPKLRDLLRYYGLIRPLRALKGQAFRAGPTEYQVIQNLCDVSPSPLAQAIPSAIRKQHNWLRALGEWSEAMCRREQSTRALFDWAVRAMGDHTASAAGGATSAASPPRSTPSARPRAPGSPACSTSCSPAVSVTSSSRPSSTTCSGCWASDDRGDLAAPVRPRCGDR